MVRVGTGKEEGSDTVTVLGIGMGDVGAGPWITLVIYAVEVDIGIMIVVFCAGAGTSIVDRRLGPIAACPGSMPHGGMDTHSSTSVLRMSKHS